MRGSGLRTSPETWTTWPSRRSLRGFRRREFPLFFPNKIRDKRGSVLSLITYRSRTMSQAELNYGTGGKELLAIVDAFDKRRSYLYGKVRTTRLLPVELYDESQIEPSSSKLHGFQSLRIIYDSQTFLRPRT